MIARIDNVVDAHHSAALIDQHADAFGVTSLWVLTSAIGQRHNSCGVGQEREIQTELLCEYGVFLDRVETRTEQHYIVLVEIGTMLLEAFCFGCACGRTGFRKKPEQH